MIRETILASVLAAGLPVAAWAGSYTYTSLDQLGAGAAAFGINNRGQVVGSYFATSVDIGFVWQNGQTTTVRGSNPREPTELYAINEKGVAVGEFRGRYQRNKMVNQPTALVYHVDTGKFILPAASDGTVVTSSLVGISNADEAVGSALTTVTGSPDPRPQAFAVQGRMPEVISLPFAGASRPAFIGITAAGIAWGFVDVPNTAGVTESRLFTYQNGQAALVANPGNLVIESITSLTSDGRFTGSATHAAPFHVHGLVYNPTSGKFALIDYPGSTSTTVVGAAGGALFGTYQASGPSTAFVRRGGQFYTVNPPFGGNTYMRAVNANGDFVGNYVDSRFNSHAFVAICPADQRPCTQ